MTTVVVEHYLSRADDEKTIGQIGDRVALRCTLPEGHEGRHIFEISGKFTRSQESK